MEEQTQPVITSHIYESYKDPDEHVHTVEDAVKAAMNELEDWQEDNSLPGIPSGFPSIDRITAGWRLGELIVIAGRPSTGKTALALNMARNAAVDHKIHTMYFSFGFSCNDLARRLLISESGLSSEQIYGGQKMQGYEWDQAEYSLKSLSQAPLYVNDSIRLTTDDIGETIQRAVNKYGIQLVFIDDFNAITTPIDYRGNKEAEMSNMAIELKRIAREQNVVIIATAMLSRSAVANSNRSGNGKPQLSDLKDTSVLEYVADKIFFIHRLNNPDMWESPEDREKARLILAKNSTGEIGEVELLFKAGKIKFVEPDESLISSAMSIESAASFGSAMNDPFGNSEF